MADPILGPSREQAEQSRLRQAFISPYSSVPDTGPIVGPNVTPADPTGYGRQEDNLDRVRETLRQRSADKWTWQPLPGRIDSEKWGYLPDHEGSLVDAFLGGIKNDTFIGAILRNHEAHQQVNAERGWRDDAPDPTYDPFNDPQLKDMKEQMWRFYDSTSAYETRLRMVQLVRGAEREREIARNHAIGSTIASMAGSLVDPTTLLPATVGVTRTVQTARAIRAGTTPALRWGVAGNIVEGAVVNSSVTLAQQMANSSLDFSQNLEGITDLMMISGGLGAGAGALSAFARRAHVPTNKIPPPPDGRFKPETLDPVLPESTHLQTVQKAVDAEAYPVGHRMTDANGTEWQVVARAEGKKFMHVKGLLDEEPVTVPAGPPKAPEQIAREQAAAFAELAREGERAAAEAATPLTKEQIVSHPQRGWLGGERETGVPTGTDVSGIEPKGPIAILPNTIDRRGRDTVHGADGTRLKAGDLPEGQRLSDSAGNVLVVRNGVFYPEKIEETPMASAATGGRGWLKPRELPDAEAPRSVLDSAPPHPVEGSGDNSMARSVSAAVVPGMSTSNLKNLLHAESLAPAGGLEKVGVTPYLRNMARSSIVVKTTTSRLVSSGGIKQNKNVVGKLKIPMETPAQVLRERKVIEDTMNTNLQAITQIEVRLSKAAGMAPGHPDYIDLAGIAALQANKRTLERLVETDRLTLRDPGAISRATGHLAQMQRALQTIEERLVLGNDSPDILLGLETQAKGLRQAIDDISTKIDDDDLALATGMQQGEKSVVSVEDKAATRWTPVIIIGEQAINAAWVKARVALAGGTVTDAAAKGVGKQLLMQAGDFFNRTDSSLKLGAFRDRVTKAAADGADRVNDVMTPYVTEAAMALHKALEDVRIEADSPGVNLFRKEADAALAKLEERRAAYLEKQTLAGEQPHPGVMGQFTHIERILKETIKNGPHQSNSKNYVPTIFRQDKVAADYDGLVTIYKNWIINSNQSAGIVIAADAAERAARATVDKITGTKAQSLADHADELFDEINAPSGAMARTSNIPRNLIEDYLENDAMLLLRYHVSSMGRAIEMTREFGDINMTRQLTDIADDYKKLIDDEPDPRKRVELLRERDGALEDTQTMRDRVLGIEGASKDPHSWSERTIRQLKHYMAWTNMGLSAFSQMADFPRTILTEGLDATMRYGFGSLIDGARRTIMDMATAERLHAGDVFELGTASGSLSMANIGDTMNSRSALERVSNQLTGMYFLANGLTWVTDLSRKWASLSIQGNMNAAIMTWGKAIAEGRAFTDEKTIAKFLNHGMDGSDVFRMYQQLNEHGVQFKSIRMANTMDWKDADMQALYRQALRRQMDRTVLTADAASRPTFMSSSVGSLIGQFKTFGFVSYNKTLIAGLQDNDRQFWLGAAALTGAGVLLNELRNQLFYGKSSFDQPFLGVLADGIDRGGVLGSVMDVNNAIELASRNKVGLRPAVGAAKKGPVTPEAMMNTFLGPSAGKAALGAKVLGDYMSGNATARTWRESRGFIPGQNLPYVDWMMDMMFPKDVKRLTPRTVRLPEGAPA